ncbi:hypothetical protein D3C73_902470 [compost metagenome]
MRLNLGSRLRPVIDLGSAKRGSSALTRRPPDIADPHVPDALLQEAQLFCRPARQVYDAAVDEWAAIIDAQDDPTAVGAVGHLDQAGQRQGLVSGGQGVHVEALAGGGGASVMIAAVPGRLPHLVVVRLFLGVIPATADLIRTHGARDDRGGIGHHGRADGRIALAAQAGAGRQG